MCTNVPCPACQSANLEIVLEGEVGVLWFDPATCGTRLQVEPRPFAACPSCEFCVDLTNANHQLLGRGRVA